jgi:hypothetical protein
LGTKNDVLIVVILHAKESREGVLQQVEDAADKIAELLRGGEKLESIYTLGGGRLLPGLPN